jgi:tetratricopeptide (TPR) repeat protein
MWLWDDSFIDGERRTAFASCLKEADAFASGRKDADVPASGPKEKACGEFNAACDADDCSPDTVLEMYHYTNGTFLELNGFLEDAIYEFKEAVNISPADGFYRYTLGVALLKNGQYNEAYKELTEALKLDPDNFEARCALADVHSEIGRSLEMEGRIEAAAEEFREAISMDPEYPDYYASLGRVLLAISKSPVPVVGIVSRDALTDAIWHLRSALRLDPNCMDARLTLGMALTLKGSGHALDEGITMLSSVLQSDPFNDEARSCLDYARTIKSRAINCS